MHLSEHGTERVRGAAPAGRLALLALALALAAALLGPAAAKEAAPASADPALEARVMSLSAELRCLVCQNETIAASNAELAVDLRNQVREMLRQGQSEAQVRQYMTDRYGDFVLYRPPLKSTTWLLWFGPALLLVGGAATLLLTLRRRNRLAADHFDPEPESDDDSPSPATTSLPPLPRP